MPRKNLDKVITTLWIRKFKQLRLEKILKKLSGDNFEDILFLKGQCNKALLTFKNENNPFLVNVISKRRQIYVNKSDPKLLRVNFEIDLSL